MKPEKPAHLSHLANPKNKLPAGKLTEANLIASDKWDIWQAIKTKFGRPPSSLNAKYIQENIHKLKQMALWEMSDSLKWLILPI